MFARTASSSQTFLLPTGSVSSFAFISLACRNLVWYCFNLVVSDLIVACRATSASAFLVSSAAFSSAKRSASTAAFSACTFLAATSFTQRFISQSHLLPMLSVVADSSW